MKKFIRNVSLVSSVLLSLGAFSSEDLRVKSVQTTVSLTAGDPSQESLERIFLAKIDVWSNGCTKASDFVPEVEEVNGIQEVTFTRVREDRCKMVAHVTEVTIPITLKSNLPVKINNPVIVDIRYVQ